MQPQIPQVNSPSVQEVLFGSGLGFGLVTSLKYRLHLVIGLLVDEWGMYPLVFFSCPADESIVHRVLEDGV